MFIFKTYDSWTAERIFRHVLYWSSWAMFYVFLNTFNPEHTFWQWLGFELIVLPIKILSTIVAAYYLMPKYLFRGRVWTFSITAFFNFLFFGILLYLVYLKIIYPSILCLDNTTFSLTKFIYKCVELIHIASLFICFKFFQHILLQKQKNASLQKAVDEAQLNYLKNQVQPHFLFNTLNNLYGMILSNDRESADTVLKLSDMMSYMLYETADDFVALEKEIAHIRNYLQIEEIRYKRKLDLEIGIAKVDARLKIAPMILIPFIENAFKHGPAKEEDRSLIKIWLKMEDNIMNFEVVNTYNQTEFETSVKSGIGLDNVQKRLDFIYPNAYNLIINKGRLFTINLTVNLAYE